MYEGMKRNEVDKGTHTHTHTHPPPPGSPQGNATKVLDFGPEMYIATCVQPHT